MNQIPPHLFWLGHDGEARDFRRLFDTGIKAVVQLAMEEPPLQPPRELIYCRFPLTDGAGDETELLRLAVRTVSQFIQAKVPTLVACGAGVSRTPAVAAAAMALIEQMPMYAA